MSERPLTKKQAEFARWYTSAECNGNGTEAARRAGYKGSDNTLASVAKENLRKPHVAAEIDRLTSKALAGADITIEKVLKDIEHTRQAALECAEFGPALRASELQGKWLKMWTERVEHMRTLDDMSTEELLRLLREVAEEGQIDLRGILANNAAAARGGADPTDT